MKPYMDKIDHWMLRHATKIRVIVICVILIGIVFYMGIRQWREYRHIQELREQGWYYIGRCNFDLYFMVDTKTKEDALTAIRTYDSEMKSFIDNLDIINRAMELDIYLLIPDETFPFGTDTICDHSGYLTNNVCKEYREHAVYQIKWDLTLPQEKQPGIIKKSYEGKTVD